MTPTARRALLYVVIVALAGIVLCVAWAAASAHCYVCPGAEPAPLPQLYLPAVLRDMPGMSAEFTPVQPVVTVVPER